MSKLSSNSWSSEEAVGLNGQITLAPPWPFIEYIITNDSATKTIEYKFKDSHGWMTLKPTETLCKKDIHLTQLIIKSTGAPYRAWFFG